MERILIVRVFSVKLESIDYEFANKFKIKRKPEIHPSLKLKVSLSRFDLGSQEITSYAANDDMIYKIKLRRGDAELKVITGKRVQRQTKIIQKIENLRFHNFENNRAKRGVFCSKVCLAKDLYKQNFTNLRNLWERNDDPSKYFLSIFIGEIWKGNSEETIRSTLNLKFNISDQISRRTLNFFRKKNSRCPKTTNSD